VKKITDRQTEFFPLADYESAPVGDWQWENARTFELGIKKFSVPNSPSPELGTKKFSVPNSPSPELGTQKIPVPNSDFDELGTGKTARTRDQIWKPPVGLLVQTWVKTDWYWYWKYYDNRRKKRSIYLGKKYNKAVAKALLIGIPADAKLATNRATPPDT
jgi:hypothetical protein